MGIISWLKSKFIKVEYKTLINISDIIKIPTRDFFKDDMDKIRISWKKIIFPDSLRSINGEIFDYGTIKISYYAGDFNYETIEVSSNEESYKCGDSVILNNNLQEIGGYVFKGL